jgi:hypothetical protein
MVERKVSVPGSIVRDANTFMQRAGAGLNIFPIQAIGARPRERVCV